MTTFKVKGGVKLKGELHPQGAKNEALQVLCAVLLTPEEIVMENIPDIRDVNILIDLLRDLNVKVKKINKSTYTFQANINSAWVVSQYENEYNPAHNHTGCDISAVIYLKTPDVKGRRNIESKKRTILYSVKQGDNLYKISELFDVSVKSIKDINKFQEETLRPGQIIKIAIKAF